MKVDLRRKIFDKIPKTSGKTRNRWLVMKMICTHMCIYVCVYTQHICLYARMSAAPTTS